MATAQWSEFPWTSSGHIDQRNKSPTEQTKVWEREFTWTGPRKCEEKNTIWSQIPHMENTHIMAIDGPQQIFHPGIIINFYAKISIIETQLTNELAGPTRREWGNQPLHWYIGDETSLIPYESGQLDEWPSDANGRSLIHQGSRTLLGEGSQSMARPPNDQPWRNPIDVFIYYSPWKW